VIYVDYREGGPKKRQVAEELCGLIRRFGLKADIDNLPYGDFAFEGVGTRGPIAIGVERKKLHDMLNCIDDSRLVSSQRLGMTKLYTESWLLLEGVWRPHDPKGILMEGNDKGSYWECRPAGRAVLYSKLRRYLFSIARSHAFEGTLYTRDIVQTAYDVCELYHYYQKRSHSSHLELHKPNIPVIGRRPKLVEKWADALDGIGPKLRAEAVRRFKKPLALANSETLEWMCIPGIGGKTAEDIMRQIEGRE